MKRILFAAFAALLAFAACTKEESEPITNPNENQEHNDSITPAEALFLGTWDVNTHAIMDGGALGNIERDEQSVYTIAHNGALNSVVITLTSEYGSSTAYGTINEQGCMQMEGYDQESRFAGMSFTMHVAPATIPVPENNQTSWTSTISGKVGIINANGTLNFTATKRQ